MAFVGVSEARRAALIAAGQPVPNPERITALIDTGASGTCVDPSVLQALALTPTGMATVNTPSTGSQPHITEQYDVLLVVPGATATHQPLVRPNLAVISAKLLAPQGFHALIGRDVLSMCLLEYNGATNMFSLAY